MLYQVTSGTSPDCGLGGFRGGRSSSLHAARIKPGIELAAAPPQPRAARSTTCIT